MADLEKDKQVEMRHIDDVAEKKGDINHTTDTAIQAIEQESRATLRDAWKTHKRAMFWSMGVSMVRSADPRPTASLTGRRLS